MECKLQLYNMEEWKDSVHFKEWRIGSPSCVTLCPHLTSVFASDIKSKFHGNKRWCSHLTYPFDGKDQRKTQTQTINVNKA